MPLQPRRSSRECARWYVRAGEQAAGIIEECHSGHEGLAARKRQCPTRRDHRHRYSYSGVAPVGAPIVLYTREDTNQSGAATLDQFARNIPDNLASVDTIANPYSNIRFSPTVLSNGINTFQGTSFNLRGLGPTATLTLLNGQRLAPAGLDGSFTDSSQIPLSAIEHIEVLPDGASAIYGADAVAGVVNMITRKDFKGAETSVRYGGATEGGAMKSRPRNCSAILGNRQYPPRL